MGSVEDPDFAKQNDRDSASRPLIDIPTKLLKEGFDVPPQQGCRLRDRRRSAQGCAGASASFQNGTSPRYHMPPPVNRLLNTDNAQDQKRGKTLSMPPTSAPVF